MIYLDMDGVICDFVKGALALHRLPTSLADTMQWDMPKHIGVDETEFWLPFGFEFWRDLPETPEFHAIVSRVRCKNYCILTTPPPVHCEEAIEGKREWLGKRGIFNAKFAHRKYMLMRPGDILIDDANHNIDAAIKHGFDARLLPRPWNRLAGAPIDTDTLFAGV